MHSRSIHGFLANHGTDALHRPDHWSDRTLEFCTTYQLCTVWCAVWYSPQCCLALSAVPTSSEHGTFDTDNADATMHGPYMDKRAMPPQKKQILPKNKTKVAACKNYSLIRSTCVSPCGQEYTVLSSSLYKVLFRQPVYQQQRMSSSITPWYTTTFSCN